MASNLTMSFDTLRAASSRHQSCPTVRLTLATVLAVLAGLVSAPLAWAQRETPTAGAPHSAPALQFDILAFNVSGNSVLSAEEIEAAIYPYLGPGKGIADAEAARTALERAYQTRGFLSVVVSLPPQSVTQSELTLEVIEAQIAQRTITGAQFHLPSVIAQKTPSLAPGSVPNFDDMQRELARAQASADLQLTPVITPGEDPRKLGIELKVQDTLPLHASLELNNKQSFNTERGRLEASLRYDNLFQRGHSIGLNWNVAPTQISDANTWVLTYAIPWQRNERAGDDRLSLSLVHSGSETPTSLGGATVVRGDTLGLRWRAALLSRDPTWSHGFSLAADFKNTRQSNRSAAADAAPSSGDSDDLRYGTVALVYDLFANGADGVRSSLDTSLVLGLPGLAARTVPCNGRYLDQFECKRAGASPRFQVLRLNASHQQPVFGKWGLTLQAQAQLAADPLVSGEQFGAGGQGTVRGYYEYEQVGDQGLALRFELGTPLWAMASNYALHGIAFVEGAWLQVNNALPAEQKRIDMASLGLGLRLRGGPGLQARLDLAVPLRDTLKADSSGSLVPASGRATRNERRWDLAVRYEF